MAIASASYTVEWKPGASWVDITASVLEVRGGNELTGNPDNALAFGDSSDSTAAITTTASLASTAWARTPIRITFTINGVAAKAFAGIVLERQREGTTLHFSCTGYAELIRATKAYSAPFALRPVATKTTASSSEDPSSGSYSAGLINWIFWQAGGRPLEQNFNTTYQAAAKFWYSCDHAALAPLWTWAAGEDGWAECQKLAQASGGQVFQASDGTVMYRQPYGYADSAPLYTFDTSVYEAEPSEQASAAKVTTSVRCSYVQRAERPMQRIAEDSTPKIIWPGRTEVITVEPSWPITELERNGSSLTADALQMTIGAGEKAILGTHYTATVVAAAQQITITITSIAAYALQLWGYVLKGKPIMASEGGSVVVGSGTEQRSIDDNPYIQTAEHAKRLASLYLLYYATPRPLRTIKHCVYDPNRTVGEVVSLTIPEWSITAQPHLITSIQHDETGLFADYQLAYVGDLPKASDYFQIGPSYAGQNKKITY